MSIGVPERYHLYGRWFSYPGVPDGPGFVNILVIDLIKDITLVVGLL